MIPLNASKSSRNTSGVRGACWDKRRNKWCARIGHREGGRVKHRFLGYFGDIGEAAAAIESACGTRGPRKYALVSDCDYEYLSKFSWHIRHGEKEYAVRNVKIGGKKTTESMHRAVAKLMAVEMAGHEIDHIDNDGLNNQRENLRPSTHSQNCCNRKTPSNSKTGTKGVTWKSKEKCWSAKVYLNRKIAWTENFSDFGEALLARAEKAREIHGEFYRA